VASILVCRALDHTRIDATGEGGDSIKSSDMGALVKEVKKPGIDVVQEWKKGKFGKEGG